MIGEVMMQTRAICPAGEASAGIAIEDAGLREAAARLFAALAWRGPLSVDAARGEDGRLHLLSLSPCFPLWVYLTRGVGRNLPAALLALMRGVRPEHLPLARPRTGLAFIRHARESIVSLIDVERLAMAGSLPSFPTLGRRA